ncbi:MAG TPA: thiamine-phosphate kinase [Thermoplasmatales archaeon]|nr:thiamine-phosphate kinase [Thermoplasmatales archaeon]
MKLSQIGERKLTYNVTKKFSIPYDDCAFIDMGKEYLLLTTDLTARKTHFPEGATFYQMGWYSIAVNISDICAKGGEVIAYTIAFAFPRNMEENEYEELLNGVDACIKKYGGRLVGGDTKEADDVVIVVNAVGKVNKKEFMPRKGSRPGEAIYVTGSIGRGGSALIDGDMEKLLIIKPRIKEGKILAKAGVKSCMDLSDGLASSLYQLMKMNNLGFRIYEEMLPISENAKKHENFMELALYHGGDYELLFTISEDRGKELEKVIDIKKIGEVIKERKVVMVRDKKEEKLENKGYEHFR